MNNLGHPDVFEDRYNDDLLFIVDLRIHRIHTQYKEQNMQYDSETQLTTGQYHDYKKKMIKELTGEDL